MVVVIVAHSNGLHVRGKFIPQEIAFASVINPYSGNFITILNEVEENHLTDQDLLLNSYNSTIFHGLSAPYKPCNYNPESVSLMHLKRRVRYIISKMFSEIPDYMNSEELMQFFTIGVLGSEQYHFFKDTCKLSSVIDLDSTIYPFLLNADLDFKKFLVQPTCHSGVHYQENTNYCSTTIAWLFARYLQFHHEITPEHDCHFIVSETDSIPEPSFLDWYLQSDYEAHFQWYSKRDLQKSVNVKVYKLKPQVRMHMKLALQKEFGFEIPEHSSITFQKGRNIRMEMTMLSPEDGRSNIYHRFITSLKWPIDLLNVVEKKVRTKFNYVSIIHSRHVGKTPVIARLNKKYPIAYVILSLNVTGAWVNVRNARNENKNKISFCNEGTLLVVEGSSKGIVELELKRGVAECEQFLITMCRIKNIGLK